MRSSSEPPPLIMERIKKRLHGIYRPNEEREPSQIAFHQLSGGHSKSPIWLVVLNLDHVSELNLVFKLHNQQDLSTSKLNWIGEALQYCHDSGFKLVPRQIYVEPVPATRKENLVVEMLTWQPGTPLGPNTSNDWIRKAISAQLEFHNYLSGHSESIRGTSRAIAKRIQLLESLDPTKLSVFNFDAKKLRDQLLDGLIPLASKTMNLQPIQVDARPEHFLIAEDKLSGIIDFSAMAIDTPAVDLARLVGELSLGDNLKWQMLVSHYLDQSDADFNQQLIQLLDWSGALLGIANWINWQEAGNVTLEAAKFRIKTLALRLRSSHSQ